MSPVKFAHVMIGDNQNISNVHFYFMKKEIMCNSLFNTYTPAHTPLMKFCFLGEIRLPYHFNKSHKSPPRKL